MKKMKRFLVALLSCLTAVACVAGISACKDDGAKTPEQPKYEININKPADNVVVEEECKHTFALQTVKAATCKETGIALLVCSQCGEKFSEGNSYQELPVLDHQVAVEATCKTDAKCACGYVFTDSKKDVDHTWVAATCAEDGYCSVCDAKNAEDLKTNNHVATSTGDCTEDRKCECGEVLIKAHNSMTDAFGNNVKANTVLTTLVNITANPEVNTSGYKYIKNKCNTTGYDAFKYCEECYDYFVDLITDDTASNENDLYDEALLVEWNLQDTSEKKMDFLFKTGLVYSVGYKVNDKAHTYDWYLNNTLATNATIDGVANTDKASYIVAAGATCNAYGMKNFKYCTTCSMVDDTTKFDPTASVVDTLAAVKAGTLKIEAASVETIKPTNPTHDFVKYVGTKVVDCTVGGEEWYGICGKTDCCDEDKLINATYTADKKDIVRVKVPAKTAHTSTGDNVATCKALATCDTCGLSYGNKAAHITTKTVAAKPATCTANGSTAGYICPVCDYTNVTEVLSKGHVWGIAVPASASTVTCGLIVTQKYSVCTAIGCEAFATYDVDGNVVYNENATKDSVVKYVDHIIDTTLANYIAPVSATCDTAGSTESGTCTQCKIVVAKQSIAKLDHKSSTTTYEFKKQGNAFVRVATTETTDYRDSATCTADASCGLCYKAIANSMKAHNWIKNDDEIVITKVDPTCQTAGTAAYVTCTCGQIGVKVNNVWTDTITVNGVARKVTANDLSIPVVDHKYETVAKKLPTCTAPGYEAYEKCVWCDAPKSAIQPINAIEHKWSMEGTCLTTIYCDCAYVVKAVNGVPVKDADGNYTVVDSKTANGTTAVWVGCGLEKTQTQPGPCQYNKTNHICVNCGNAHDCATANDYTGDVCDVCNKKKENTNS